MSKIFLSILLLFFLTFSLSAESIIFEENGYQISGRHYELDKKDYTVYDYFKSKDNLLADNYDTIYLMVASPSTQSIGSFGGHTFIVLSKGDDFTDSTAINFYGEHETLTTFNKAVLGSTKGLPGYIDIRPFSQIAERYTVDQERTIFFYKLDIDKDGIDRLINRLYEIEDYDLAYQFFTENCADIALILFEAALNKDFSNEAPVILIPSYLPVLMEKNGLILEKGSFSPPIVRLNKEDMKITKEEIEEKKDFYNTTLNETSFLDESKTFIPQKDEYNYGTNLDSYISQISFGVDDTDPTLGFSFFTSERYEQRQGPTQALQINFIQMELLLDDDNDVNVDNFKLFEFSSYPKINYDFGLTQKLMIIGETNSDDELEPSLYSGLGISLGNKNMLFDITGDVELPLSYLGLSLSINSEIIFYNEYGYILLEGNLPYYQLNTDNDFSLKSEAGITLFDRLDLSASYDWIDEEFESSVSWNFNPF
ncbi:MAG: DUF4105 domain-containing protein [Sphaerochaeta sp.]